MEPSIEEVVLSVGKLGQVRVEALDYQKGVKGSWKPGVLIGRTLCDDPHYDVRLDDGALLNNLDRQRLRVVN